MFSLERTRFLITVKYWYSCLTTIFSTSTTAKNIVAATSASGAQSSSHSHYMLVLGLKYAKLQKGIIVSSLNLCVRFHELYYTSQTKSLEISSITTTYVRSLLQVFDLLRHDSVTM